jgi:ribosomal protein L24
MKNTKIEMYDTVRISKGFFQGKLGVVTKIKDNSYVIEVDGCPLHKDKKDLKKI